MRRLVFLATVMSTAACMARPAAPAIDHHQHLLSPAMVGAPPQQKPIAAKDLIGMLDAAGIQRAVVLSNAYRIGSPFEPPMADEYARVIAENEWTARETAKYPKRLVAFCGVNALKDYALMEIARCAAAKRYGRGIKLQFGVAGVNLDDPADVALLRRTFRAANAARLAIVVHMRTLRRQPYGAAQAHVFLDELLVAAPDVAVQIAHFTAGGGGVADPPADEALAVFTAAIARGDPRVKNLYFDLAGVMGGENWAARAPAIAAQIRAIGVKRILYGTDGGDPTDPPPSAILAAYRQLPLTVAEFKVIDTNHAPYFAR